MGQTGKPQKGEANTTSPMDGNATTETLMEIVGMIVAILAIGLLCIGIGYFCYKNPFLGVLIALMMGGE